VAVSEGCVWFCELDFKHIVEKWKFFNCVAKASRVILFYRHVVRCVCIHVNSLGKLNSLGKVLNIMLVLISVLCSIFVLQFLTSLTVLTMFFDAS